MIISETDPSSVHDGEMMSNCSNLMEYSPNNITNCPNYNKKAQITLKVAKKMSNCPNPMEYSPNNIINCPNYNKKAHITLKVAQNNVKMPKFH